MASDDAEFCASIPEAAMQRTCGPLYYSIALEAFAGMLLFFFFAYVWLKLQIRGNVKSPAWAFYRMARRQLVDFLGDFFATLGTIGKMGKTDLETRMRFCSNCDRMCCVLSLGLSIAGVTRWLSFSNVNGLRYLGYFLTCPLMQLELVVLIAPWVPCYQISAAFTGFITCLTLSMGYGASLLWMPVYEGYLKDFVTSGFDIDALAPTQKFWVVCPSLIGITFLSVLQIPYLAMCFLASGGGKNPDLPQGYLGLLFIVWFCWLGFPVWWLLSWEGQGTIEDTKWNEVGFTVLNIVAKGLFIWKNAEMGDRHKARIEELGLQEASNLPKYLSRQGSRAAAQSFLVSMLQKFDDDEFEENMYRTQQSGEIDEHEKPKPIKKKKKKNPNAQMQIGGGDAAFQKPPPMSTRSEADDTWSRPKCPNSQQVAGLLLEAPPMM